MRRAGGREGSRDGFTLIELLVAMVIASMFLGIVGITVGRGFLNASRVEGRTSVVTDVQYALDTLSKDVRTADPVVSAAANSLSVIVYRSGVCSIRTYAVVAKATGAGAVRAGYRKTDQALTAASRACTPGAVDGAARSLVLAVPAGGTLFRYADKDGVAIATPTAADLPRIARVTVTVTGALRDSQDRPSFTTDITVRNAVA